MRIHPWHRLVYVEHGAIYHKVQIDLEGISYHVWKLSTAATLLSPYCSIESVLPETSSRQDLSTFKLIVWTARQGLTPEENKLHVPEPLDEEPPLASMRRTLNYMVRIRVLHLILRLPQDSPPPSPPPTTPMSQSNEDKPPERTPKCSRQRRRGPRQSRRKQADDTPPTGQGYRKPGTPTVVGDTPPAE